MPKSRHSLPPMSAQSPMLSYLRRRRRSAPAAAPCSGDMTAEPAAEDGGAADDSRGGPGGAGALVLSSAAASFASECPSTSACPIRQRSSHTPTPLRADTTLITGWQHCDGAT